jgi:hypothetical protein
VLIQLISELICFLVRILELGVAVEEDGEEMLPRVVTPLVWPVSPLPVFFEAANTV